MVGVWVLVRLRRRVLLLQSAQRGSFASNTAKELWDRMKDLVYTETSTRVSRGIIWDLFGFRFMLHSVTGLDNLTPNNSILLLPHSFYSNLFGPYSFFFFFFGYGLGLVLCCIDGWIYVKILNYI